MPDQLQTMSPARHVYILFALLIAVTSIGLFALGGGVAHASVAYGETASFGTEGTGPSEFKRPTGVAVDQSNGDVYVVDAFNARVQKFGPKGEFILTFGKEVNETKVDSGTASEAEDNVCAAASNDICKAGIAGPEMGQFGVKEVNFCCGAVPVGAPTGIAVDPENGNVYVADSANQRVEEFGSEGIYLSSISDGFSKQDLIANESGVAGVAVDPVADTEHGGHDLYVTDSGNNVVDVFDSAGAPLTTLTVANPDAVAFDSSGNAYVIARKDKAVDEFASGKGPGVQLSLEGGLQDAEGIAVDSAGDLLVFEHEENSAGHVVVFEPTGTRLAEFGSGVTAVNLDGAGVATDLATATTYLSGGLYATGSFDKVSSFERQEGAAPAAQTGASKDETGTTATLTGMVNPGGPASEFWFAYGLTESYGSETPHASAGSGASSREVTAEIEGLEPHSTYHYRLFAHNGFGTTEASEAKELATLPEAPLVSGEQAPLAAITQTGAEVQTQVNPNNEATHWHVEYSTSPSLSDVTSLPSPEGEIPASYGNVPVSQPLSSLTANTIYYWRTVASNTGGGLRQGTIESFLTLPETPATATASDVRDEEATLNGSFNPGNQATSYYFEYGPAACAPSSCATKTKVEGPAGASEMRPAVLVAALAPLTTYHYRLVVENASGPSYGPEEEFTTLPQAPAATSDPPTSVTATSAIIAGEVVPQCVGGHYPPTNYRFEYGTSIAYGTGSEEAAVATSSCATGGQVVSATLTGLEPNTVYHYRLVARNSGGENVGADRSFTTNAGGEPNPTLPAGFSLTGTAPGGLAATMYPSLTAIAPTPIPKTTAEPPPSKPLTRAEKLAKVLKQCGRDRLKSKRKSCEASARKRYGPGKRKKAT